jgi:hypothetical protein
MRIQQQISCGIGMIMVRSRRLEGPASVPCPLYGHKSGVRAALSVPWLRIGSMSNDIPPRLAPIARNQAGVVSRQQALDAGLTRGMVDAKVKSGWWEQVHEGIYKTFTGGLTRDGLLWAAVLYAGRDAYLSHGTASALNGLTADAPAVIDVTIPASRSVRPPKGIVIHRSTQKPMIWRPPGIPAYSIAEQTVIDLARDAADKDEIVALVTSGFNKKLLTENHLRAVARTRKKLRWRDELDEIISLAAGGTHSSLEYRHDTDVQRAHGLPEPVKQAKFLKPDGTSGYRDRCYPQYGQLVIELDGQRFHPDDQRGLDQERDNQAAVTGSTLRYGWSDVTRKACETARQQAEALRHRGWTGKLRPCSSGCRAVSD